MIGKVAFVLGAFLALSSASVLVKSLEGSFFQQEGSCVGRCNVSGTIPGSCQCNIPCQSFGDCCDDYVEVCIGGGGQQGSCAGKCDTIGTDPGASCQCNKPCVDFGDCCPDYEDQCGATGGPISNADLAALSEELLSLDTANNVASLVTVDLQGRTSSGSTSDLAPNPLLTVSSGAYQGNTISKLIALHDNYVASVSVAEQVTSAETAEENAFITAIFDTPIMQRAQAFLVEKGLPNGVANFREIWFGLYSRSGSTLGSSGFEHIFLGELKSGVSGFHNWAFFARQEDEDEVNYRGYMDTVDLGSRGSIIEHNFQWQGESKPVSSMFIGTSPEFELALYTVCWHARPNAKCPVSLNGNTVGIQTYDLTYNGKKYVASAYPDLSA